MSSDAAAAVSRADVNNSVDRLTCNLRSWYKWMLANTQRSCFHSNIDITVSNTNVTSVSHYNEFVNFTEKDRSVELVHPLELHRSVTTRTHDDQLSPVDECFLSAKFSSAVCYYASMYHHVCLLDVSQHHVIDDEDARQHLMNERSAADSTELVPTGHVDMTVQAQSTNTSISLSNDTTSRPSTDKHNAVHSSDPLPADKTATKVLNTSSTRNVTQELSAAENNARATAANQTAESETTTAVKAATARRKKPTPAPANKLTTAKLTYEEIMKSVATTTRRKLNKPKISRVNIMSNTSKPNNSSAIQPDVAKDEKLATRKINPSIKSAARLSTVSRMPAVKRIDYCQRAQTWFIARFDEKRSSAKADTKVFNATTKNVTSELPAVEKTATTAAASSPTAKTVTTKSAKTKATTTRGMRPTLTSAKLTTSKLTYKDLVKSVASATRGKLRNPEVPNVNIKSNTNAPTGSSDNQHQGAKDAKSDTIKIGPFIPTGTSTTSSVSIVEEIDYCQHDQTWLYATSKEICLITATRNAIGLQELSIAKNKATTLSSTAKSGTTPATRIKVTTARGKRPVLSATKLTTTKLTYKDLVKSFTSASERKICNPKAPNVSIKSNISRPTRLEIAKDAKPRTTKTGPLIPHAASVSTVPKLDYCPRVQEWFSMTAESSTRRSVIRVESDKSEKDRQHQPAETHNAEKHTKVMDKDDTANRHRYDIGDKCDQSLRLMEMKLLQLDNQLLQSNVDRITATVKLDNYVMRLELEFIRLNQSFVEVRTENEQLHQRYLEVAAASNNRDQERKVIELTDIVNNQSSLLVTLQDKFAGLERDSQMLVEQCKLRSRPIETKLQQLENQFLQSTNTLKSIELENCVMRLESQLVELNRSFVEVKSENEHLRQRNSEISAATNNVDQQRMIDELTDILNNQSSNLVQLQDKYAGLERDNRLLVERLLNQSLIMNQMLLRIEGMGTEQSRQALQLMDMRLSSRDQSSSLNRTSDILFPHPTTDNTKDCYDHYLGGHRENSVMTIHPAQRQDLNVSVFCDMTQRGWTVIQRRTNGAVDFYRSWNQYKQGFGSVSGEHWLGNEVIHLLTSQDHYSLRVSLTDWDNVTHEVDYDHIRVTAEQDNYRLYVAGYHERPQSESGSVAGDSLLKHNGCRFSTYDVDNDQVEQEFEHGSCARRFAGAWWYYRCYMSNLNGRYYSSGVVPERRFDGVAWKSWKGSQYSLKRVEMKIRPARVAQDDV